MFMLGLLLVGLGASTPTQQRFLQIGTITLFLTHQKLPLFLQITGRASGVMFGLLPGLGPSTQTQQFYQRALPIVAQLARKATQLL